MNFLAHIYLSGGDHGITIGNFIADAVKGRDYNHYPEKIRTGILLHRAIDSFTDQHPTVKKSKSRLYDRHGLYSGVIVDILYDHFLAVNWADYHKEPLEQYVNSVYKLLQTNIDLLPVRYQKMMPHMIADNWLVKYATVKGIGIILTQMNRRTGKKANMDQAVYELQAHYAQFEEEFRSFFDELSVFTQNKLASF